MNQMRRESRNVIPFVKRPKAWWRPNKNWPRFLVLLICSAIALSLIFPLDARVIETVEFKADFVRVVDADTINGGGTGIRIKGIAAPEDGHPSYRAGKEFLGRLIRQANSVTCHLTAERTYDRRVGRCMLKMDDGTTIDMQRAIVKAGHARGCPRYGGWRYLYSETAASRSLPFPPYCWGLTFF
jgi:micrococcal nuclease